MFYNNSTSITVSGPEITCRVGPFHTLRGSPTSFLLQEQGQVSEAADEGVEQRQGQDKEL